MPEPLYRVVAASGCTVEVFDARITIVQIAAATLAEEVTKLEQLRDRGALTNEEFTTAKRRLLGVN